MVHLRQRAGAWVGTWPPEMGDAALYAGSAVFAALAAAYSTIALYRVWGQLGLGVYLVGALLSLALIPSGRRWSAARGAGDAAAAGGPEAGPEAGPGAVVPVPVPGPARRAWWSGRWRASRVWVFVFVLAGATLFPLSIEVADRGEGSPGAHVQPEVTVIEQAGKRLAEGKDPYHAEVRHGRVVSAVPGEPAYESFFPYLPLMAVFGLPRTTHVPVALDRCPHLLQPGDPAGGGGGHAAVPRPDRAQGAGAHGPDGPAHRGPAAGHRGRRHAGGGHPAARDGPGPAPTAVHLRGGPRVCGGHEVHRVALAVLAPFAAADARGRRAPWRMAMGMAVVVVPVVVPFVIGGPHAFVDNAILFPLGLAGIASPAASPLPGHLLVTAFPWLHRALPVVVARGRRDARWCATCGGTRRPPPPR